MTRKKLRPIDTKRILAMVVALIVCTCMLWFGQRCSHKVENPFGAGLPAKSGGDTIDVAIEISPLSYSMIGDTIKGLDYELVKNMAALHGRAVKFHPFAPLQYALEGLNTGIFDVVVTALPSTRRLKDELLLTRPIYLDRQVLVQRTQAVDSANYVSSAEDLAGKDVWVSDGSPIADRLVNLSAEIGDSIHVHSKPGRTSEHLVHLVAAGKISRAVVNEGLARAMCANDSTLSFATPISFTQFQVWAISPNNRALQDSINVWLEEYQHTNEYTTLLDRYHLHPANR